MSSFKNINFNSASLDSLFSYLTSGNCIHKPLISAEEQNIINSQDSSSKAQLLFAKIIDWQNELTKQRIAPDSQVIYTRDNYVAFVASQNALNKLKRKFNKFFLENVTPAQTEEIAKKQLGKIDMPVTPGTIEYMQYIIKNFGYNDACLKLFAKFFGTCELLCTNDVPTNELINLQGFSKNEEPSIYTMLALLDVLIKRPICGNTWGFPGQEPNAVYSEKANAAADARLNEIRSENYKLLEQSGPMSYFKQMRTWAKLENRLFIGNCREGAVRLFNYLIRDHNYGFVALCHLAGKPIPCTDEKEEADHVFVIAQENVVDGWDLPTIFHISKINQYLRDFTGYQDSQGRAITRPFDPTKQEIEVLAYNLYPSEAFKADSRIKHRQLEELLEGFHQISDPQQRISKALYIISFMENKMPLYEHYDPVVEELYDQLMYFTKEARKKGIKCDCEADIIPINEALKNLDKPRLKQYLSERKQMDDCTILHALKASYLTGDMDYYTLVAAACPYDNKNLLIAWLDANPKKAIQEIYKKLFPN